jgi:hypothetical protein
MPYLITKSIYPSDKAPEAGKKYLEALTKYPPDEHLGPLLVPAGVKSTPQGIEAISVTEVKPGKLEEAITYVSNFMAMFLSIQGYESTTDVYLKAEEALGLIGMKLPG